MNLNMRFMNLTMNLIMHYLKLYLTVDVTINLTVGPHHGPRGTHSGLEISTFGTRIQTVCLYS